MAVKWIGDAAHELGIFPLDAVEILASRQEYPLDGLVDEDRFKTLRVMLGSRRLESSGSQAIPAAVPPPGPAPAATPTPRAGHAAPPPRAAHAAPPPPPAVPPLVPAPPPQRPPVGEATSITAPFQTIPPREGEKTVILSPIDPKR